MTASQKRIFISAVHNLAENAEESLKMGAEPADYGVEHKDDFTWEMAVQHGIDTLWYVVHEDGLQGAIDNAYIFDEDENDNPTGLEKLVQQDVEKFLRSLKGTRTASGNGEITETV